MPSSAFALQPPPAWPCRPDGSNLPVAQWSAGQRAAFIRGFAPGLIAVAPPPAAPAGADSNAAEPSALQQLRARRLAREGSAR